MKQFYPIFTKRFLGTSIIIFLSMISFSANYYVSNSGKDSNSGLSAETPWQTLNKVNTVVLKAGDNVLFRRGDTFFGSLIPLNSGTSTAPITFGAYGTGLKPIISGFETITSWTSVGNGIYSSPTKAKSTLNMVTVNGINTPMGRYPKSDWLTFESFVGASSITDNQLMSSPNWTGAEIVVRKSNWTIDRSKITTHSGGTISYTSGSPWGVSSDGEYKYFIQHHLGTLTQQGDWFCDGTKFYMFFGSNNPNNYTVKVSTVDKLVDASNRSYWTFDNIDFKGANEKGVITYLSMNINIKNSDFSFMGDNAIYSTSSQKTIIENSTIQNCNGTSIYLNAVGSIIRNNTISDGGLIPGMGNANGDTYNGIVFYGTGSICEYNTVKNVGYNGIRFYSNNSEVRYNLIDGFCSFLTDGGGIYTFVGNPSLISSGQKVFNNIVMNGGGNGLYNDNSANHVEWHNNTVMNVKKFGIHMNDPYSSNVHDNIFYHCGITGMSIQNLYMNEGFAHDNIIASNTVVQGLNTELCLKLTDLRTYKIGSFGTSNNNIFIAGANGLELFRTQVSQPSFKTTPYDFTSWKAYSDQELNSQLKIADLTTIRIEYNATKATVTVPLNTPMVDSKGIKYSNSITLQPFASAVLLKDATAVLPGPPTSIVATGGNASATVTFAAPATNGGSAITGYTVTSTPAGGIDSNAGTTSLIHTITGLTNGTSYTFTVKATTSAGTSVASVASNAVIPSAPKDITAPIVSAFSIPTTSTSRTVSISAYSATDQIGVTGFLLTETPSTPSPDASGWSTIAPSTYVFSSGGLKVLYAWAKDMEGNVSASRYQEVSITIATSNNNTTVEPDSHFKTVWSGENGQNHMNIIVVSATLEGLALSADDEIAVFSGSLCVGTKKLSKSINPEDNTTFITIKASQNDGSNNGFADNDTIIFKIWDNVNQLEKTVNTVKYKNNISAWINSGKYVPSATSTVEINVYTENSQTITLKKGYNLISTYLTVNNPDVTSVTKSLYDDGNLIKVQDESGNSFENWGSFGGWTNKLGFMQETEGYKIQVANNCTLQVIGRPIALPLDIPLKSGWNIISFPRADMVDAKVIVQSLIDRNMLIKVQDEVGNSIENWGAFGGWKNGIGNFIPGKAYKVKMNTDAILTLQQNYTKSSVITASSERTEYFASSTEGNGTDHMNINLVGFRESEITAGDELAAFDGDICVGALKLSDNNKFDGSASLVVSSASADNSPDGFKAGNTIQLRVWNHNTGSESKVEVESLSGSMKYEKNASVIVKVKALSTGLEDLNDQVKVDMFPNPSNGKFTVRFSQLAEAGSRIEILDIAGRKITSRLISDTSEVFNLEHLTPGIYVVKSILGSKEIVQKMIIN